MPSPNSRYALTPTTTWTAPDGTVIPYLKRRFVPLSESLPLRAEVTVAPDDRLDLIAARTLGDPVQWWRVADANEAMDPFDLTDVPGVRLRVPIPQFHAEP